MPKSMFRCTEAFVTVDDDGHRRRVAMGDLVPGGDPILKGRESLFAPVDDDGEAIQTATKAPGERSTARRAKKSPAKKSPAKKADDDSEG